MRGRIASFILLLAVAMSPTVAPAMNERPACRVVAGEKYLDASVRSSVVCTAIERAIAAAAPNVRYTAEVRALSPTRLAAVLTVNGKRLPEHKFAVMDRGLGPDSVERFARALAADVAGAAKR